MEKPNVKVGDTIRIVEIYDVFVNERYNGKEGVVEHIDDLGQLHGTWGGVAIIPEEDKIEIIKTK